MLISMTWIPVKPSIDKLDLNMSYMSAFSISSISIPPCCFGRCFRSCVDVPNILCCMPSWHNSSHRLQRPTCWCIVYWSFRSWRQRFFLLDLKRKPSFFYSFFQNIAALQRFVLRWFMLCGKKAKSRPTKPLDPNNGPIFWVTDLLKQHCFRKSRQVLPLPDLTPRYACGPTWPTFKPLIWGISYRDPSDFAVWPTATFSTFLNYICVI